MNYENRSPHVYKMMPIGAVFTNIPEMTSYWAVVHVLQLHYIYFKWGLFLSALIDHCPSLLLNVNKVLYQSMPCHTLSVWFDLLILSSKYSPYNYHVCMVSSGFTNCSLLSQPGSNYYWSVIENDRKKAMWCILSNNSVSHWNDAFISIYI